jgi:translation initiation factor 1
VSRSRLVYSTEFGRACPACGRPVADCTCSRQAGRPMGDGIVRVRRESAGRGGKTVTVIWGVPLDEVGLRELAAELKRRCGTGGTVKDGVIEIQGDHRETLVSLMRERGYTVKPSGA